MTGSATWNIGRSEPALLRERSEAREALDPEEAAEPGRGGSAPSAPSRWSCAGLGLCAGLGAAEIGRKPHGWGGALAGLPRGCHVRTQPLAERLISTPAIES